MSVQSFIDKLEPIVGANGVVLSLANVDAAGAAAGFNPGFATASDQESGKRWVNPTPFIPLLVGAIKAANENMISAVNGCQNNVDNKIEKLTALVGDMMGSLERLTEACKKMEASAVDLSARLDAHCADSAKAEVDAAAKLMGAMSRISALENNTDSLNMFTDMFRTITAEDPPAATEQAVVESPQPVTSDPVAVEEPSTPPQPAAEQVVAEPAPAAISEEAAPAIEQSPQVSAEVSNQAPPVDPPQPASSE